MIIGETFTRTPPRWMVHVEANLIESGLFQMISCCCCFFSFMAIGRRALRSTSANRCGIARPDCAGGWMEFGWMISKTATEVGPPISWRSPIAGKLMDYLVIMAPFILLSSGCLLSPFFPFSQSKAYQSEMTLDIPLLIVSIVSYVITHVANQIGSTFIEMNLNCSLRIGSLSGNSCRLTAYQQF